MSYLLEALRKSERERQQKSAVPDLQTPAVEWEHGEEGRTRSPWLTVAVIAICLNTVLLALLVWRFGFADRQSSPVEPLATTASQATQNRVDTKPVSSLPPIIVVEQPPANEAIVVRQRPAREARVVDQPSAGVAYESAQSTAATDRPMSSTRPREAAEESQAPTAASSQDDIPSINALPANIRQQLPMLTMNSHIYANTARESFVLINGTSFSPGDEISAGLKLVAVVPEGALLEFKGQRFVLPALASFIP